MIRRGILLYLLFLHAPLYADIYNRNYLPMGDRSAFMANTAVADGKNSTAVLFNPGTLGFVENSKVSLSGNLYFNFDVHYEPFFRFNNEGANLKVSGFNSLPNSAVSIYHWGENTFAFSVLVPDFIEISTLQKIVLTNYGGVMQFNGKNQDLWVGGTWARKWRDKFGVGISVFGARYSRQAASAVNAAIMFNSVPVDVSAVENMNASSVSIESVMGVFFRPFEKIALGLKFAPPGIRVSGSATYFSMTKSFVTGTVMTQLEDRANVDYYYRRPADASLGTEIILHENLRWYTDLSLQFPLEFEETPGISKPGYVKLEYTPRISTGFDIHIYKFFSIMTGFAWVPSALAPLEPRYDGKSRATNYVTTVGIIYSDDHVRTGLGAFYLFADGEQQLDKTAGNTGAIRLRGVGALLSSSYVF